MHSFVNTPFTPPAIGVSTRHSQNLFIARYCGEEMEGRGEGRGGEEGGGYKNLQAVRLLTHPLTSMYTSASVWEWNTILSSLAKNSSCWIQIHTYIHTYVCTCTCTHICTPCQQLTRCLTCSCSASKCSRTTTRKLTVHLHTYIKKLTQAKQHLPTYIHPLGWGRG